MQGDWYSNKAEKIQAYADSSNMKDFFASLKSVYGPQPSGSSPLLSSDGQSTITDRSKILDRCAEHFQTVLNRPSNVNTEAINRLEQTPINNSLAERSQAPEVKKAIKLSSPKAPDQDCIQAERYASGSPVLVNKLTELFCEMWKGEASPRAQGCLYHPPIQEEREQAVLWQPLWNFSLIHSWKDTCMCRPKPLHQFHCTGLAIQLTMRIQTWA